MTTTEQATVIAERLAKTIATALESRKVLQEETYLELINNDAALISKVVPLTQLIAVALAADECKKRSFHQPAGNGRCLACEAMESLEKALQNLRSAGGVL